MQQADNLRAIPGVDHGFCTINDPLRPEEVFICKQVHSASVIKWQAAGVRREQIEVSEVCTYCTSPTFASYRRRPHHPAEMKTLIYSWIARITD